MGLFNRNTSPERAEYKAAKKALANDPVNTGAAGRSVDIDSPAGRANLAAQDRVRAAEGKLRRR
jgi:hypothetical protein